MKPVNKIAFSLWFAAMLLTTMACGGKHADADSADRTGTNNNDIVGSWFRCEFVDTAKPDAPPADGCTMLDDDGLRFTTDGSLYAIEATNSPENVCNKGKTGKCFARDTPGLKIDEKLKGTYQVEGGLVKMTYSSGNHAEFKLRAAKGKGYHLFENYVVRKATGDEPKPKYRHMYRYELDR